MMKNKGEKANIVSSHKLSMKLKAILAIVLILFAVISINLVNGNIQKLGLLDNQDAKKAESKQTTGENIGGLSSTNTENTVLDSYQIMYFQGVYAEECTYAAAMRIKNAGFTVVTINPSPYTGNDARTKSKVEECMGTALSNLKLAGLNAIVSDYRISENATYFFYENNNQLAKDNLDDAVRFYSQYSNVVGYKIADEPCIFANNKFPIDPENPHKWDDWKTSDLYAVIKVINYLYEIDPQRPSFVNMFGYPVNDNIVKDYQDMGVISDLTGLSAEERLKKINSDYDNYINAMIESKTPYLSIDPYPQYLKRTGISHDVYYSDLKRLANRYTKNKTEGDYKNLITNSIAAVTDHWGYEIYKQDIDFQISTSLAHGAKMAMYFTYSSFEDQNGRFIGMIDFDNNITNKYTYVQSTNVWAKNTGDQLFNKDVKAVYFYNDLDQSTLSTQIKEGQTKSEAEAAVIKNVDIENKYHTIGRISSMQCYGKGETTTADASFAIVSIFDDNTRMIVNGDAAFVSDRTEASQYQNNTNKKRGKYIFYDFDLRNAMYFDSISGEWIEIGNTTIDKLSSMGLYIDTTNPACKYIVLDQGRNVLLKYKNETATNYTLSSIKYKIDSNKNYIYTGTEDYASGNVAASGASIEYKSAKKILHIKTTTNYYDNIPVIKLNLTGYTVNGANSNGTEGTIIVDDTIDMSKVSVTNGYAVYDPTITSDNFKVYSNNGALVDTKTVKKANPVTVTGKTNMTYLGSEQTLATTSNVQGTIYYSTTTALNSSNYSGKSTTIPKGTDAGNYTIYWYTPGNSTYGEKSGTATAKIGKATPTITLSPTSGSINKGSTTTFTANVTNGAGALKDPTSSNTSVATASKSGKTITVTGVSTGTATITVSCDANTNYNSKSATYSVTVKNATKPTREIIFSDASSNPITSGEILLTTQNYKIYVATDAGSFNVTSSDTSKALVSTSSSGEVTITPLEAGTVTITAKTAEESSYESGTATYTLTIKKPNAALIFKDSNNTVVTSGTITMDQTIALTVSRPSGLAYTIKLSDESAATASINGSKVTITPKATGTVRIVAKTQENDTYAETTATYTLTITQAANPITVSAKTNLTYSGSAQTLVTTNNEHGTIYYSTSTQLTSSNYTTGSTTIPTGTDAKNYTVYWYTPGDSSYSATSGNVSVTISPKILTIPTATNLSFTYDGGEHGPSVSGFDVNTMTQGGTSKATNVNNYSITWSLRNTSNYKWSDNTTSPKSVSWKISAKSVSSLTVTLPSESYTYTGGEIKPEPTVKDGSTTLTKGTDYTVSYSNHTNVGTATVTITGKGNYTGTKDKTFSIVQRDLSNATITLNKESFEYNGSAQTPTITVKIGNTTLTNNTDYTVAVSGNTNVGTATITVTGKGIYSGSKTKTYTITKKTLAVTAKAASKTYGAANPSLEYTYSGQVSGQTPGFTGELKTTATQSSAVGQYDITNNNLVLADNGSFKASNYSMSFTGAKLTIQAKNVSSLTVTLPSESYTYTGGEINPEPTVKDGSTTLTKGTDYTVSYSDHTNVGTGKVTITGKGNYSGTKTATFTITQRSLSDATITLSKESFEYNGSAQTPTITVKIGNTTLTNNTDYTVAVSGNTNVGTATITVTGKGNYSGNKTKTYTITKKTLAVTAEAKTKEYGAALPTLTYKYSGQVSNQTPGFTGNLATTAKVESNVGEYDITKGDIALADNGTFKASNYSMSFTGAKLTVSGKTITNANITLADTSNYTYDGSAKKPTVTVKDGNTTLTKDTDYTVSYSDNTNAGTATVTVSGKGNYGGTKTTTFTIKVKTITPTVTLNKTSFIYNGTAQSPEVTVKDGNTTLTVDTDYTLAITKNTNVGTADVVVTLKGNYSGNKTEHFTITKRTLTVTADARTKKYGEENPSLTYKYSGQVEGQTPGFTGKLTTTANNQSNVGEYDIIQGTLDIKDNSNFLVSNYELTFVKGKLTVEKADGRLVLSHENDVNLVLNCSKIIEYAASGAVTAVSSKDSVATVEISNGNILITSVAVGEAQITITSGATNNYKQTTKTINVTVVPVAVESIEIKKLPKTSYIEGQNLDVTNGKIRAIYNNRTEEEINITSNMVTGYNKNKIGEQTLTVTYNGLETNYTVVVREKQVTNIEMKYNPNKEEFIQNYELLDLTGAKIKVYYDNGTNEEIAITQNMVSGYDNTKVGVNTLTVTYEGKECTFDVRIVEKHVTEIAIIELPNKLEYVQDYGMLDVTGGKIRVYFDDETDTEVNMNTNMISGFNNKVLGEQTLIVKFAGKSAAYQIEVIDKVITKIEMQKLPDKTEYVQNYDKLDVSGAKLKLTFNDSYIDEINVLPEMVSGFDNTKLGTKTITVKYAEKETTFDVSIVEHSVVKVEIFKMPNKVEYKIGEKVELTGGKIKLLYNDEKTEVVDMNAEMLEVSEKLATTGRKLVTLSAYGQEISFEVNVIEDKVEDNNSTDSTNNTNTNIINNTSKDNTTAKTIIPQTGLNSGAVIIGAITLTVSAGIALVRVFKNKNIK